MAPGAARAAIAGVAGGTCTARDGTAGATSAAVASSTAVAAVTDQLGVAARPAVRPLAGVTSGTTPHRAVVEDIDAGTGGTGSGGYAPAGAAVGGGPSGSPVAAITSQPPAGTAATSAPTGAASTAGATSDNG